MIHRQRRQNGAGWIRGCRVSVALYVGHSRAIDIEEWHTKLRNNGRADGKGGLAPRTIGHAHRLLSSALTDAVKYNKVTKNVVETQSVPKVPDDEDMVIVQDVPAFIEKLKSADRLQMPGIVSLLAGMRLGEVFALRWSRVDLDKKIIQVREALEEAWHSRQDAKVQGGASRYHPPRFTG